MNQRQDTFLTEVQSVLEAGALETAARVQQRYGTSTTGTSRQVRGVAFPRATTEVQQLVRIAKRHQAALYPVSSGKNWGYGCATPVHDSALVVDFSRMNRVLEFDRELGVITLEPGVTQGQLAAYLDQEAPEFMVPVTGAGPDVSLVGNALERGYGLTPNTDHFGALTRLVAVLPDGNRYVSALEELGGKAVNSVFRWGIGPSLEGLFSQGSFGLVTEATLVLARRPQQVEGFFFRIARDEDLEATVGAIHVILRDCGAVVAGTNLVDAARVLSMQVPYPKAHVPAGEAMSAELVQRLAKEHGIAAWTGFGGLYGTKAMVRAVHTTIRRALSGVTGDLTFVDGPKLSMAARALSWLPGRVGTNLRATVAAAAKTLRILEGRPSEVALPLAYWKSGTPAPATNADPQRDGCGLLWHAPLVPMRGRDARRHVELVRATARECQMEAPITFTALSDRCFDSTVPLLFDRAVPEKVKQAQACQQLMLERSCAEGFVPYRLGTHQMEWFCQRAPTATALIDRLAHSVDADGLVSPGRYRPATAPMAPRQVDSAG